MQKNMDCTNSAPTMHLFVAILGFNVFPFIMWLEQFETVSLLDGSNIE